MGCLPVPRHGTDILYIHENDEMDRSAFPDYSINCPMTPGAIINSTTAINSL